MNTTRKTFAVLEGDSVRHQVCHHDVWRWVLSQCEQYHLRPVDFLETLKEVAQQPIEAALQDSYGFRATDRTAPAPPHSD